MIERGSQGCGISFSSVWNVLGPFQIGTREATWGADPLEYMGGFHSLQYDANATYCSSLAPNGVVSWSFGHADTSTSNADSAVAALTIEFTNIDWHHLQSTYGWAALQYQAWIRGNLIVDKKAPQTIRLYTDCVLEFRIDDEHHFGGDFYTYRRAPLILRLDPGSHKLDVRLIRDVRSMGAIGEPSLHIKLEAQKSRGGLAFSGKPLLPDIVGGKLASNLASVSVRNEERSWIEICDIRSVHEAFNVSLAESTPFMLAPGQSRSLVICLSMPSATSLCLLLEIVFAVEGMSLPRFTKKISCSLSSRAVDDPHKITFRHPSGNVSYAILRAPSKTLPLKDGSHDNSLPVFLTLHGAGLEADSHQVRHMFDAVPDLRAWVLYPTGVTPWSGDDWHNWGFADAEAAVEAIPKWISTVQWEGPSVNLEKWLVSGHSNGGQGTWYALTHRPSKILGGAPVSGYSSIQGYVPYTFWRESDPRVTALIQNSLLDYRHELLVDNMVGIPIHRQHSDTDDNVPSYHSRRMGELISQTKEPSDYTELKGKDHWFDGVMTTTPLCRFYNRILQGEARKPETPRDFTIVIANPATMSARGGIAVDQLVSPDQLGKIQKEQGIGTSTWTLRTSNILRFHIEPKDLDGDLPKAVMIDGCLIKLPLEWHIEKNWFVSFVDGSWKLCNNAKWISSGQRYGSQLGPLDSILRTRGKYLIYAPELKELAISLQVSRNLFQYFFTDAEITGRPDVLREGLGNVISVEKGKAMLPSPFLPYPITVEADHGILIQDALGRQRHYAFEEGMGAVLLRPLPRLRLELMIWGFDDLGLRLAARLLPMLTGAGQPEFVIISKTCAWKGAAGVVAMGSFDSFWKISKASFVP